MSNAEVAPLRVLVVDDHADVLDTTAAVLSMYGYDVRTAARGATALALVHEWHPHVALIDLGLPDISGYELAERVRASPLPVQPLLIALTGWGRPTLQTDEGFALFNHYFVKPVSMEVVRALLAAVPTE